MKRRSHLFGRLVHFGHVVAKLSKEVLDTPRLEGALDHEPLRTALDPKDAPAVGFAKALLLHHRHDVGAPVRILAHKVAVEFAQEVLGVPHGLMLRVLQNGGRLYLLFEGAGVQTTREKNQSP